MKTFEHDPDDSRGCIKCPMFSGVPRDGVCRALDATTLDHNDLGHFKPDEDCPLREGPIQIVGSHPCWRIVPMEVEALLPPHRIEFHPDDPNIGRGCPRCGFAVPQGCRYVHAEWCEKRKTP